MDANSSLNIKTSFTQKTSLILLGIFLTLIALELGMRLGGGMVLFFQEQKNKLSLRQKGTYRIMCIGESTTQGEYPHFLEEILNQHAIGIRFSVIDKGLGATNTSLILSELENNLKKYNPDMVIAMMGINDGGTHMPDASIILSKVERSLGSLKTYKLARFIALHIVHKIKEARRQNSRKEDDQLVKKHFDHQTIPSPSGGIFKKNTASGHQDDQAHIQFGNLCLAQGKIALAKEAYREGININPINTDATFRLAWLSEASKSQELIKNLIEELEKATEAYPRDKAIMSNYELLGSYLLEIHKDYSQAEKIFKKLTKIDPRNDHAFIMLGKCYQYQGQYVLAEDIYKHIETLDKHNRAALNSLQVLYHDMGRDELAAQYARKANKLDTWHYSSLTVHNYREIKRILNDRKIRLVCVQYPLRSIESLKNIFAEAQDIVFVDNEDIFNKALINKSYKEYFRDMFAGDFGHCTPEGNRLLAENITNVILKEVFGQ